MRLLLVKEQRPQLRFQRGQHRNGEQIGADPKKELALQVAEMEGDSDFGFFEERLGFPGSLPSPVSWVILVVS